MTDARKSDLLLVLVTLLAAISWIFSKESILLMPPLLFMAVRFLIAGLLLAVIACRALRKLSADQLRRSLGVGLVFGTAMCLWVMGLAHIESMGEGAFLTSLGVVFVPVIARLVFREAQPVSTWLALPIAVCGLALLSLKNGFRPEAGQLFFVSAAAIFAFYFTLNTRAANQRTVINKHGQYIEKHRVPALPLTALALTTVGLVTLLASAVLEPWSGLGASLSPALYGWVLASALVGTAGRFLVQTYAQGLSAHSHGVVILVLEPVWVALFAALWFGESMAPLQMAGCSLIFAALVVNRWGALSKVVKQRIQEKKSTKLA
ncbi:DMT family transporter [Marinobacter lutaoensis]|jgi:drug/metabolite transporter (DMT)-like permease|uniref:DMT family transporter n=1 Tax=Marinobacter lutaoensis TaxID=135739 RepID=UPI000C5AAFC1|nr:DMT family transporter [Marinobacter lutaoensis]MBI42536.1 EamA family transporter [Oceanospirillales bacterium]NVD36694.1 DMT family transporter [Marinobacter lutaoensis]|tara:strand:+ start:6687 stop:7646 length:960 start_codon:yes stop_codon:yes gene_type:complete